ncbi:hypothetical protein D3C72_919450 [compost metagenome]
MHFLPRLGEPALTEFLMHGGIHAQRVVSLDMVPLLSFNGQMIVAKTGRGTLLSRHLSDASNPLIVDVPMLVMFDMPGGIVLYQQVQVFLTVDINLFLASLVFKAQLIEPLTLVGFGAQHGAGLVGRQLVGRPVGGMIGAAGDDGLVRVPLQE